MAMVPYLGLLFLAVIVGGVIMLLARRAVDQRKSQDTGGFTLSDLEALHASGELSREEYLKARERVIAQVKRSLSGKGGASSGK